jgi:phosphate-selective porin
VRTGVLWYLICNAAKINGMHVTSKPLLGLSFTLLCVQLHAQVLRSAEHDPNEPVYGDIRPQPSTELQAKITRMHELVRELQQADLSPEQKQAELDELIKDHDYILRQHDTWLDWQKPQTVDSASLLLEKMVFEEALDIAPTAQSREQVLHNVPQHLELDPNEPQVSTVYEPPLLAPMAQSQQPAPDAATSTPQDTKAAVPEVTRAGDTNKSTPATGDEPDVATSQKTVSVGKKVDVAVLADDQVTASMHDDNTVLRDVRNDKGELVLFGKVRLWVGGALQLDAYRGDGLFTLGEVGGTDSNAYIRRGEGILRASIFDNAEIKAQYDFDANIFRNLYWRWVSDDETDSVTVGNQKEPLGLDYMVGSKFTTALEPSAPSSAFGAFRSKGVRYNGTTTLPSKDNPFKLWGDSRTYVTGSIGLFGEDIENSNDTDWAVTGRVSMGGNKTRNTGFHLGASASYRHGEYDRIAPRPGLEDVNRIPLAAPIADTLAVAGLELMYAHGSLHSQAELYYSDYSGGEVDAQGWGGYGQVGWLFGGKRRSYRPNWGQWAPIDAANEHVFEVFARASLTHGDDDINSSNELGLLTLGGNWYYHQFRVSANLIFADTERDIVDQSDGYAMALRLQYLF